MQPEKMQVQLCPQLVAIQTQLKTAIANHQVSCEKVYRSRSYPIIDFLSISQLLLSQS